MNWFTLFELITTVLLVIYVVWHFWFLVGKLKSAKLITGIVIIIAIALCQINLLFFGILVNAVICLIVVDIIRVILMLLKHQELINKLSVIALVISFILSGYGIYNVDRTIVTYYDVTIDKKFTDKTLMVVSDIHLGTAIDQNDLAKIETNASKIVPDAIILLGDIYDENTSQEQFDDSLKVFERLASNYFVCYLEGNHEVGFQGGNPLEEFDIADKMEKIGVQVLFDKQIMLDDIYLIGRLDYSDEKRTPLKKLTSGLDLNRPLILLDHQPQDYQESKKEGIDLQVSGHSHAGQIFPLQYLYELIRANDLNYGMISDGSFHAVVTSGMGAWGFPMRTAQHSEIVVLNLISK